MDCDGRPVEPVEMIFQSEDPSVHRAARGEDTVSPNCPAYVVKERKRQLRSWDKSVSLVRDDGAFSCFQQRLVKWVAEGILDESSNPTPEQLERDSRFRRLCRSTSCTSFLIRRDMGRFVPLCPSRV